MDSTNRFKLEEAIYDVWNTMEKDLENFHKIFLDFPTPMTEDQISNTIMALQNIHKMRCEVLFDEFRKTFNLDQYALKDPWFFLDTKKKEPIKVEISSDVEPKKAAKTKAKKAKKATTKKEEK